MAPDRPDHNPTRGEGELFSFDFKGDLLEERLELLERANIAFTRDPNGVRIPVPLSTGQSSLLQWAMTPTRPLDLASLSTRLAAAALDVHTAFWNQRLEQQGVDRSASASSAPHPTPREAAAPDPGLAESFGGVANLAGQLGIHDVQVSEAEWDLLRTLRSGGGLTVEDLNGIHAALGLAVERYDMIGAFDDEPGDENGMRDEADEVQEAAVKLDELFKPGEEPFRYGR